MFIRNFLYNFYFIPYILVPFAILKCLFWTIGSMRGGEGSWLFYECGTQAIEVCLSFNFAASFHQALYEYIQIIMRFHVNRWGALNSFIVLLIHQYPEIHSVVWKQARFVTWLIQSSLSESFIMIKWDLLYHRRTSPHCQMRDTVQPNRVLHHCHVRFTPSFENEPSLSSERSSRRVIHHWHVRLTPSYENKPSLSSERSIPA